MKKKTNRQLYLHEYYSYHKRHPNATVAAWRSFWSGYYRRRRGLYAKRKHLGFHPMNESFPNSQAHHFTLNDVLYIPRLLHRLVKHNIWSNEGMERMNALAFAWYTEDWT